jgi:DNA-binding transcriptional LysR family regulator
MGSDAAAGHPLDWNDVRFFLALARARTLAKAAIALGVDQTTVGRRIAALERRLGVAVFERTPLGLDVTPAGRRIRTPRSG